MRRKSDMHGYQDRVATYLYEHDAVQAVIPPGGGKTCSGETAIAELIADKVIRCALVIAPQRVAQLVWPAETKEWEHLKHLGVVYVDGTAKERINILEHLADVYTIGIDLVPWLVDYLKTLPEDHRLFDCLVIDESSKIKDPRGTWGKKLQGISRRWRIKWWLTGTFAPNDYMDQFRPLAILTGGRLWGTPRFDPWREKHFIKKDFNGHSWEIRPEHEAKIIKKVASITITVDRSELPQLPLPIDLWYEIDLPQRARQLYDQMARTQVATLYKDHKVLADNAAIAMGKMEQIAQGFLYDGDTVTTLHDVKIDALTALSETMERAAEPHIIVYQFDEELRLMQERWPDLQYLGNGISRRLGAATELAWNRRQLSRLGLHPGSAAHGLNLQFGGCNMVMLCQPWSAEAYEQVVARIVRSGQREQCRIHHIVARNTLDQEKRDRVEGKITEQEAFRRLMRRV